MPKAAGVQSVEDRQFSIPTPAVLFTNQLFSALVGSIATGPPSPVSTWFHATGLAPPFTTPAVPFAPSPASNVEEFDAACASDSTSASDEKPAFKFWKCVASVAAQTDPVSATPSIDRQSPLSLPTNISSGFAAGHASACWYCPTWADAQVVVLVVFRHTHPAARLHFHTSLSPANSSVSCPLGTAVSARL